MLTNLIVLTVRWAETDILDSLGHKSGEISIVRDSKGTFQENRYGMAIFLVEVFRCILRMPKNFRQDEVIRIREILIHNVLGSFICKEKKGEVDETSHVVGFQGLEGR